MFHVVCEHFDDVENPIVYIFQSTLNEQEAYRLALALNKDCAPFTSYHVENQQYHMPFNKRLRRYACAARRTKMPPDRPV